MVMVAREEGGLFADHVDVRMDRTQHVFVPPFQMSTGD